jgi:protein SCO1/2
MSPRLLRLSLGLVTGSLAALLYLGVRGTGPSTPGAESVPDPFLPRALPAPSLVLDGVDGRTVRLTDFRGQVVALFFGYTRCPDVCPITMAQLARLRAEIDPGGDRLQIVFVSLDPARDSASVLERFVSSFEAGAVAATAPVDRLRPQVLEYGIGFVYRPRAGGPADSTAPTPGSDLGDDYLVDHTARTFVIDPEGRLVAQVLPESRSDVLRDVLSRVLEGS